MNHWAYYRCKELDEKSGVTDELRNKNFPYKYSREERNIMVDSDFTESERLKDLLYRLEDDMIERFLYGEPEPETETEYEEEIKKYLVFSMPDFFWLDETIRVMEEMANNCLPESCKEVNNGDYFYGLWAYGSNSLRYDKLWNEKAETLYKTSKYLKDIDEWE